MLRQRKGFSMLMAVMMVSFMTLAVGLGLISMSTFDLHSSITFQGGFYARSIAQACAEEALEQIRVSSGTTTSGGMTIDGLSCSYTVTDLGGEDREIEVSASHNGAQKNITIVIDAFVEDISIVSWDED